jgi:Rrf2 family protein
MISQTAEYALRAAAFLGEKEGILQKTHEISDSTQVPPGYLTKILTAMCRARIVHSRRGPRGGFVLARPAQNISVFDVITSVSPWNRMDACPLLKPEHSERLCPVHQCIADAQSALELSFRKASLRDLIEESNPEHRASSHERGSSQS